NGERNPTDSSSHPSWRPREFAWKATTGEDVPIRKKRSANKAERRNSRAVRAHGGQCRKCKRGKRRVRFPSHLGLYPSFFNLILQSVIPLTLEALPKPAQQPRLLRAPPPAWPFHGSWFRHPSIGPPRLATT